MNAKALIALCACLLLTAGQAFADARIPAPHRGKTRVVFRWSPSGKSFSPSSFGNTALPGSSEYEDLFRVTGINGISRGWAFQYDLRAGRMSKGKHGSFETATGPEDQIVGVVRGLRQSAAFSDAVSFNVLFPTGSTSQRPELGDGLPAVEPRFEAEWNGYSRLRPFASLEVGPRVYGGGAGTQLRAYAVAGTRLRGLSIGGTLFFAKSLGAPSWGPAGYDVLRAGVEIAGRERAGLRPVLLFDTAIAGRNTHQGSRLSIGFETR